MSDRRCGKCGGPQKEGFFLDRVHNSTRVGHWAEGAPQYWLLRILKMRGRRKLPIQAWRCSKCGLLECYANGPES
jgi:hypothetical protein